MHMAMKLVALAIASAFIASCQATQPPQALQNFADRNYMRYAMDKPYADIAEMRSTTLEGMMGRTAYGDLVEATPLADGNTIYRHIDNVETGEASVDAGLIMQSDSVSTTYRLAYFRVGPDGVINDWAVGNLPGERSGCISYAAGIFERCNDEASLRRSVALYDTLVRTSDGEPLSAWGPFADESAEAQQAPDAI